MIIWQTIATFMVWYVGINNAQDINNKTVSTNNTDTNTASQKTININEPIVCDCGFIDENNNVWTDVWYANYEHYKSNLLYDPHYQLMDYSVGIKHEGSFERVFKPKNVKVNNNGSITLSVKKTDKGDFTSAAFGTRRSDFLYGTFRARMKTSNIAGTVAAFYYYRNSTSEIDMEALSRYTDPFKTFFAIQPQIYENGIASNLTSEKYNLTFDPTLDFHEYRFDWLRESVKFYVDGKFVREMVTNIPQAPGRILVNHWTDGNPNFSGGPPAEDTDMKIAGLNFFFNSSETKSPLSCFRSKTPCSVSDITSKRLLPGSEIRALSRANAINSQTFYGLIFVFILSFILF